MPGLGIQGRTGFDVVRDIRDGHDQTIALALAFAVHGIVEIASILAVDGHQG